MANKRKPTKRKTAKKKTGFRGPSPNVGKATQFQPGQSGNPGGRPKSKHVTEAYRLALEQIDPKTGKTRAEMIAESMINKAIRGFVGAAQEIANRTEGKAKQPVQIDIGMSEKTVLLIAELAQALLIEKTFSGAGVSADSLHPSTCQCTPCNQKRRAKDEAQSARRLSEAKVVTDCAPEVRKDRAQVPISDHHGVPIAGPGYNIPMDLQGDLQRRP